MIPETEASMFYSRFMKFFHGHGGGYNLVYYIVNN